MYTVYHREVTNIGRVVVRGGGEGVLFSDSNCNFPEIY
jgi:hypothetical protein